MATVKIKKGYSSYEGFLKDIFPEFYKKRESDSEKSQQKIDSFAVKTTKLIDQILSA